MCCCPSVLHETLRVPCARRFLFTDERVLNGKLLELDGKDPQTIAPEVRLMHVTIS